MQAKTEKTRQTKMKDTCYSVLFMWAFTDSKIAVISNNRSSAAR